MLTKKIKDNKPFLSQAFLYWRDEKKGSVRQQEIKDFLSIGRDENNILVLNDSFISRRHVRIEKLKNKNCYLIKDMGSQNGVFLNGSRIQTAILTHNDTIKVGSKQFTFSFERYNQKWQMVFQSQNKKWNQSLNRIPYIAKSNASVLILGPSGTGKELIAQMIHSLSERSSGPMVSINCSALTESLIESEFFGHTRGSYTGSVGNRKGAFLTANKGSLFMDEIGDLPLVLQPKLLRAIEYKEIKPVGSDIPITTDTRIISATHQNLTQKVSQKMFRKDLFFRLNVVTIQVPSLVERMEDFDQLLQYFSLLYGVTFSTKALEIFKSYHWPGNIRELKNTVERAKALYSSEYIDTEKAFYLLKDFNESSSSNHLKMKEKKYIMEVLKVCKGNQSKVSEIIGIPPSSLFDKIKKYKINPKDYKKPFMPRYSSL
ncbi:MAG: sigma 54-interacting transcriptional regulator [Bdellovibrionales bacterium]|nr:sigma 54-interacting transcriptional regulator [Bdellovibrionales bacterium]